MNDCVARYVVRGLVAATVAAAISSVIAARLVLSHGSGTYFALHVFLPLLVVPGAIAWRLPRAKFLALWAAIGWVATLVWSIAGDPYSYERELPGWSSVSRPAWLAIALVIFIAPLVAISIAKPQPVPPELELFATRLRRFIVLALLIASSVILVAVGLSGGEGVVVGLCAAVLVVPGMLAYRDPRPRWGWAWAAWCVPFALFGTLMWQLLGDGPQPWQIRLVGLGFGTIFVLLLIGLPIVCMATPREPTGSSARASYRSRNR